MWNLPGWGLEPVSPALAGGFLTTTPPGKSLWSTILMTSLVRKKQIPLSLTEGGRKTLKVFRILTCLWYSWRWRKLVIYNILVYHHYCCTLLHLSPWKKAQTSLGGLWTLKANISRWSFCQVNFKAPALVGSLLQLWVGLLIKLQSKQPVHQIVLELSVAYRMEHWMKPMKPVAITHGRITAQATRILEQYLPWQVILHSLRNNFSWFLDGQGKRSEEEHFT